MPQSEAELQIEKTEPPANFPPVPRHFLAAIVESSDDAIVTKDLKGTITSWNKAAQRLFGYTAEEAVGKPVTMLIPLDRQDEEPRILAKIRRGERIDHYETIRRRKDGTIVNISLTVSPVRDQSGRIIGASKIARDITERKYAENANRFLAAVVESSDDAIITKNLDGTITSWNKAAERLFGYTAEEAIGNPVMMLLPLDRLDEEPGILARIRKGEKIDHFETVRRRKDGTTINISLTVSPVREETGRIIGASKIARDISELMKIRAALAASREQLEETVNARTASLKQAIAQMEEFSYSVSHDLRAPVRAMHGFAEAVLEDCADGLGATGRDYLERIVAASARMQRLIHDVLTYSKVARSEIQLHPVCLDKLIAEIVQQYPEMQPPHAEVTIRSPLTSVLAHEPSLAQAVSNLLSNSVKFVPRGTIPRVQIWTEQFDHSVRLWFQDNGIGIKPDYQARLFGMFERAHNNPEYEGTGIGLAIVRKATERMGGKVGVQSDGVLGSSFWIELPASTSQ